MWSRLLHKGGAAGEGAGVSSGGVGTFPEVESDSDGAAMNAVAASASLSVSLLRNDTAASAGTSAADADAIDDQVDDDTTLPKTLPEIYRMAQLNKAKMRARQAQRRGTDAWDLEGEGEGGGEGEGEAAKVAGEAGSTGADDAGFDAKSFYFGGSDAQVDTSTDATVSAN